MGKFLNPGGILAWLETFSRLPIATRNPWFVFPTGGGFEPRKQGAFGKMKKDDVFPCAGDPAW